MNKTTRIAGIDNKYGRKSRTGSTISMNISDIEAMECQQYLMALEAGEEPNGRIKKIELVMYSEDDLKSVPSIVDSIGTLDTALGDSVEVAINEPTEEKMSCSHQPSLDIYEKPLTCEKCLHRSIGDEKPCNIECLRNKESESKIDLFENEPRRMRV